MENLIKVKFFFRKQNPKFNSIEELFKSLIDEFQNEIFTEKCILPNERITLKEVIKNIKYARIRSNDINHITGHVNYIALGLRGKTLLTIHDTGSSFQGNWIHRFLIKIFFYYIPAFFVDKITVISEFSKTELIKLIPFARHKIQVVYNPINKSLKYSPNFFNKNKPLILLIGTKPNKNLDNTIKALEGIDCRLNIIGKLNSKQLFILKQSGIEFSNQYFLSYNEIINAYKSCDLVSFASTYEGFGMPIIEGQAIGRPVLTSNIGAMKEVAGEGACLVNPYNAKSIRKGVQKLINNDKYRTNLIKQGLKNVKRFQSNIIANEYLNIYKEFYKD